MENVNNIEKGAENFVLEYESKNGRNPKLISKDNRYIGFDIISNEGLPDERIIEVKGRSGDKRPHVLLNEYNIHCLQNTDSSKYFLYIVMNPLKNPNLIIFSKKDVLNRKRESRIWKIPLRKIDYENT